MSRSRSLRIASLVAFGSIAVIASVLAACADDGSTPVDDSDASLPPRGDGSADGTTTAPDAGADAAGDASADAPRDASVRDGNGPGEAGAVCSFNYDCQSALRCECDETTGCECKAGVRGTGQNGVDPCVDGNGCVSAVCVEGPPDSGFFCSDECDSSADCTGKLPVCSTIAFVGRICIRQP